MKNNNFLSYEEAVKQLGSDPCAQETIQVSYLDEFPPQAWKRFIESEEWKELTSILDINKGKKLSILDLGAGNGIVSFAFSSLGHKVVSADPNTSERVGLGALKNQSPERSSVCTFAEALPFPDECFDLIYTRQTLHHLKDLRGGLKEMARVLKRKGIFLATRDHVVSNEKERELFLSSHPLHALHGGEWAYTLDQYREAIRLAGLSINKEIKPYDSVINHFPFSNKDISDWLYSGISRKFGSSIASVLAKSNIVLGIYRSFLSSRIKVPGRLYSWICSKETI